jgi:hypothetical protein
MESSMTKYSSEKIESKNFCRYDEIEVGNCFKWGDIIYKKFSTVHLGIRSLALCESGDDCTFSKDCEVVPITEIKISYKVV